MENRKIATNKILWIFAIGQLGWSILAGIISNWLVYFYQPSNEEIANGQTIFIPQGTFIGLTVVGMITAIGRIFDAVTDPYIAGKSDSMKHKLGRRIPFMQYAAIPLSIVTVLLFCAPVEEISGWNVAWISVFIVLFYLFILYSVGWEIGGKDRIHLDATHEKLRGTAIRGSFFLLLRRRGRRRHPG